MSALGAIYSDDIHHHFKTLYATWLPNEPLQIGDIGLLQDNLFVRTGDIKTDFGISFDVREFADQKATYEYSSSDSTSIKFNAKGSTGPSGPPVKASLEIDFSSKNSVFFNAAECVPQSLKDQIALGNAVMDLFKAGKWDANYAVITSLLKAGSTTVIVSGSESSSIVLEAQSDSVQQINLGDASIGLQIQHESNVAYKVVTQASLTPLLGLSKVQHKFFGGDHFGPKYGLVAGSYGVKASGALNDLRSSRQKKDIEDIAYFGMMR
jgi:hypothetical protein